MNNLNKFQTLFILLAILLGLLLGQFSAVEQNADVFIVPALVLMLYGLFLSIPLQSIRASWQSKTFLATSIGINFLWSPLLAFGLGALFLSDHPALWIGFILLMVTPCTDWYLIFTAMAKGNVTLATSVLPMNLLLQIILLPIYILVFAGSFQLISFETLLSSIVIVFALPFLAAGVTRFFLSEKKVEGWIRVWMVAQVYFLMIAIVAMFASQGSLLVQSMEVIGLLFIPIVLFFIVNFFVGKWTNRLCRFNYADSVSLQMTIIARNSPVALAFAVAVFPDTPLVALALVIGPLIELPILALLARVLLRSRV
ncbi:LOW QUALITY PROTEIN: arsenical-resistance protein [Geomicrobium sp. JCM 19039]|nr:LOW QUALITY PROTEIN: arsenical-resistance protein [Geomicrobium sp. JCM 19039]